MSTVVGKDLCSYPDQICGGRTKSASVICLPGPNLLALSVPPDQIRGWTDFTVTPALYRICSALIRGEVQQQTQLSIPLTVAILSGS